MLNLLRKLFNQHNTSPSLPTHCEAYEQLVQWAASIREAVGPFEYEKLLICPEGDHLSAHYIFRPVGGFLCKRAHSLEVQAE